VPNLQATISNQLTATAAQTTLSIQELVATMKAQGMADNAIRQTLLNDLNSGGQLFGTFRNKLKNTVKNGVQLSSNEKVNEEYKEKKIKKVRWVAVSKGKACPDCIERDGKIYTLEELEIIGLPGSGFSVCQGNCKCEYVAENYKDENLDKPLENLGKKIKPKAIDFKMAGKHKTVKDSLDWMKSNIADKVSLGQIKDVNIANQITISLKENFEKYKLKRLESVTFQKGRALAAANGKNLYINQRKLTKKHLEESYRLNVSEYGKPWRDHLKLMKQKYAKAAMENDYKTLAFASAEIKKAEKRLETLNKFKRHNTFDKNNIAKSVIDHEIGHIIHDQKSGGANGFGFRGNPMLKREVADKWNNEWIDISRKAKKEGLINEISEYASSNRYELFAESYALYVRGEKLPDIIQDYLDRYLTTKDFD
tara:strand:+ start:454 stop:1725 length:1272 start_codon:yes stop_codon:yes gene_type:complete